MKRKVSNNIDPSTAPRVTVPCAGVSCARSPFSGASKRRASSTSGKIFALITVASLTLLAGCKDDMKDRGRLKTYEASPFFADGLSERPLVEGTITRTGHRAADNPLYSGKGADGALVNDFPIPVTEEMLRRGQSQYNIFCSVCHGLTGGETNDPINGRGNGMIVQRGFTPPPSLHLTRLKNAPIGHFFDVISNGWGAMYSYAERVQPEDRWAIVAYIRTLQVSQGVNENLLTTNDKQMLEEAERRRKALEEMNKNESGHGETVHPQAGPDTGTPVEGVRPPTPAETNHHVGQE